MDAVDLKNMTTDDLRVAIRFCSDAPKDNAELQERFKIYSAELKRRTTRPERLGTVDLVLCCDVGFDKLIVEAKDTNL